MDEEIEGLKSSDQWAWEQLVERLSPGLFALFGSRFGLPQSETRELVAEVFYRAFRGIGGFRGTAKIDTWIYAIAANVARDFLRKRKKESSFDSLNSDVPVQDFTDEQLDMERISAILLELPPLYQNALTLYFLNGHKYSEIAEIMRIPVGTVKTLIHRGKKMLREKYMKRF